MKKVKNAQQKSWETRRKKNDFVESYKKATTAGTKRSIYCRFKNLFNEDIKKYIIAKTFKQKSKVKAVPFNESEIEFVIPYNVKKLVEQEVEKRFAQFLKNKKHY